MTTHDHDKAQTALSRGPAHPRLPIRKSTLVVWASLEDDQMQQQTIWTCSCDQSVPVTPAREK